MGNYSHKVWNIFPVLVTVSVSTLVSLHGYVIRSDQPSPQPITDTCLETQAEADSYY